MKLIFIVLLLTSALAQTIDHEHCQWVYWNLLCLLNSKHIFSLAPYYIREFEDSAICDSIGTDLSHVRYHLAKRLGFDHFEKILAFDADERLDQRALDAVLHYREWHKDVLVSTFNFTNRFYYYFS